MGAIQVNTLKQISNLSEVRCADFSEAAAVCLDAVEHSSGALVNISGDLAGTFMLIYPEVTTKMIDSRRDMEENCRKWCLLCSHVSN